MKIRLLFPLAALLVWLGRVPPASAQGTAISYQGRLTANGTPADGAVELQCTLWNALSGGTQVATATPATTVVTVTNGLFATPLDFGTAAFDGSDRYLQIEARTKSGPFSLLTPRQKITATPYALLAGKLSGTVASNGLGGTYGNAVSFSNTANVFNGTFTGNGASLSNLNATSLGGLSASSFWKLGGNAGTAPGANFVGTADNQPLEFKVNGVRALRLEPTTTNGAVNVIAGSPHNSVAAGIAGATIGGGGGSYLGDIHPNQVAAAYGTVSGGVANSLSSSGEFGTVGGGAFNWSRGRAATVGGGEANNSYGEFATVAGGHYNSAGPHTTVGGGLGNNASGQWATVGGGRNNTSSRDISTVGGGDSKTSSKLAATVGGGYDNLAGGSYATVPGGIYNTAAGEYSFAAGKRAKAIHDDCFVWSSRGSPAPSFAASRFHINAFNGLSVDYDIQRADGGGARWIVIGATGGEQAISAWNGAWLSNGGAWINASDRNRKDGFAAVNPREILNKLAALPIQTWHYTNETAESRHLGPVAQDFRAAFGLGSDDKSIGTVDADGVALAAIQGLNQKVEEKEKRISELEKTVSELKELVGKLAAKGNGGDR